MIRNNNILIQSRNLDVVTHANNALLHQGLRVLLPPPLVAKDLTLQRLGLVVSLSSPCLAALAILAAVFVTRELLALLG